MTLNWKGIFKLSTAYEIGDVVYFIDTGFTYVCVRKTIGRLPPSIPSSGFELLAGFEVNISVIDGGEF